MMFRNSIVAVILLVLSQQTLAATVTKSEKLYAGSKTDWMSFIYVVGVIDRNTPNQVASALNEIKRHGHDNNGSSIGLSLNSEGGNVEAAIEIGILARNNELATWVHPNAVCASACTLTFLGGVVRTMLGRFGIHRPYSTRYNISNADATESYDRINKATGAYLAQMNITPRLLEAMNVIPPSEIRWLTESERNEFGIDGGDPVYADRKQSEYAKKHGISKGELYRRQQSASSQCINTGLSIKEMERCYSDVMDGRRR